MKRFLQRYGILILSLGALFASGIAAGYRWGAVETARTVAPFETPPGREASPEQWTENAAAALQKDLSLDDAQTDKIRQSIAGPSREIFEEKHRANLKIHLRLLEAHDKLARDVELSSKQQALLKLRREQLRKLILEKFRDLIGDKPDAVLSNL